MAMQLRDYLNVSAQPVRLLWHGAGEVPVSLQRVAEATDWLTLHTTREAAGPSLAAAGASLQLSLHGSLPHGAISWHGPVEDRQLHPLVETLRALATGQPELDTPATRGRLGELLAGGDLLDLRVYVSSRCPYCPAVTAATLRFAVLSPRVSVEVHRADLGGAPENVRSVPTILLGGHSVSEGSVGEYALVERIAARRLAAETR